MNSKKIISLSALIIIGILVIATIVLACVPKSYTPLNVEPTRIVLGENQRVFLQDDENTKKEFNQLYDNYKKSFSESTLNSLFNGRLSKGAVAEYTSTAVSISSLGSNYVMFVFKDDKTIKINDTDYTYNKMVIELKSNNVMETVKAYLFNDINTSTNYYINTIGNLDNLVEYVNEIK